APIAALTDQGCCFPGSQAQVYDAMESRVEGQSLVIQCPYNAQQYSRTGKTWCRLREKSCFLLVSTIYPSQGRYQNKATAGRATIQDDTRKGTVTITMEKLQVQDSGEYLCAVLGSSKTVSRLTAIKLNVYKEVQEHDTLEGQSLSVQCPYNRELYKRAEKAWCRSTTQSTCDILVSTDTGIITYHNGAQNGRATIHDNPQTGIVTVTMEKLQTDDTGVYWCVRYEPPDLYRLIEVKLTVTKVIPHASPSSFSLSNAECPCSFSLSNERTFIILGVVLGVLFILALIGVVILCTRKSRRLKSKGHGQGDCVYEEPRNTAVSQDYSIMNNPKDDKQERPQDLKYATLTFKAQPSPKESIYANVVPCQVLETPHTMFPTESVEYSSILLKPLASGVKP
uniref:Ig-like domain-containing protein n=1 Tax=Pelodiscus sinensis TaxID=13735 RepID=K7G171_PELSI